MQLLAERRGEDSPLSEVSPHQRDPDYRLRIGPFRIFYTVDEKKSRVNVVRIPHKDETADYYQERKS